HGQQCGDGRNNPPPMMDQAQQDRHFIEETFPAALARLKATHVPAWGQMSPTQVVDHLRVSVVLPLGQQDVSLS
ncbi:MAG: hypothetical protein RI842_04575, partial [Schleiferiaceae bacterium]|nr:hypothetical protein [Schleiferiaceae bacterium]